MQEIEEKAYFDTLKELLQKKSRLVKEPNSFKKKIKLKRYLVSRGFEFDLILLAMEDI
jgi:regulatory protein